MRHADSVPPKPRSRLARRQRKLPPPVRTPGTGRRRRAAVLLAAAIVPLVAACTGLMAPQRMPVAGGSVVIAGPAGYCVDTTHSKDSAQGAFVLLGSCAALSNTASAPQPKAYAVLTAAVSAGASGAGISSDQKRLARYFESPQGRAALSRSGRASTVRILGHHDGNGAFFLHLRDSSAFPGRPDTPESWRVLFDLNGHIVTLSVVGLPNRAIGARRAETLLRAFMAQVRAESPKATAAATTG
ncbi:hypothetical protein [Acidimangrovimonas sediminis]|uniref:hypothetical protein n=1 Tax=Acidimangrovimonas sediminis TaxID=2056283 RepID=UPI000C809292|nr:hypothetical protein [Acidimangrovimonas sediminis]